MKLFGLTKLCVEALFDEFLKDSLIVSIGEICTYRTCMMDDDVLYRCDGSIDDLGGRGQLARSVVL